MASVLMLLSIMFAGCGAAIRGFPEPPDVSSAISPNPGYQLGDSAILMYNKESDPSKKRLLRNEILDARIAELDSKFAEFERKLYRQGIGSGIGTDWANLVITGAVSVTGSEKTKAIGGAMASTLVGAKASYDKRALLDATLPALLAQMQASREVVRALIRGNQELSVEDYTLYAGLSDLKRFEFAGSIPGSLQSIAESAGVEMREAKQKIAELRSGAYVKTKAGDLLRAYWKPDGTNIDSNNETALKTWMGNNGLATGAGSITMFLRTEVLEEARLKAVKELGLDK